MNRPALLDFDEARRQLLELAQPLALREGDFEDLPTNDALDRVLARDQVSTLDVPPMDNSQMDGYAVRAADLVAGQPMAVSQRIAAGEVAAPLAAGTAARIFTGAMVPAGADAVIMQEQAVLDGGQVRFDILPAAGDWIRRTGEDIRRDSVVLTAGTRLTPQALGLAASVGLAMLPVRPRLRVACFFTGDELAMPGETLAPGAIYNSNRFVLVALLRRLGCDVTDLGIVPDSLDATRSALREAARRCDLIVTSGGMSVGEEDHVRPALEAEGSLRTWQIAIKPGKPLAWGAVRRADGGSAHFIGLPGNPVSSFVTFLLFVRPFILRLQGATDRLPRPIAVRADFDWPKPDRRREFLRVRFNQAGGLDLFANQGSGVLTSTVWADGLIDNPPLQAIRRGDLVAFLPMEGLL
ncbi:MAG: molybdopterin molybdotransferase MoeA [Burkholderiales bacterium]|nr:molybdopterin molybdotransferase MoeA [Burkholderiales bacterium]